MNVNVRLKLESEVVLFAINNMWQSYPFWILVLFKFCVYAVYIEIYGCYFITNHMFLTFNPSSSSFLHRKLCSV